MKFKIKIIVSSMSDKKKGEIRRGLELLREYERLKFPEEHRGNTFGTYSLVFDITEEIASRHPEHFEFTDTVSVFADSKHTKPGDWDDWGSAGMVLSRITIPREYIEEALSQNTHKFLKLPRPRKMLESGE